MLKLEEDQSQEAYGFQTQEHISERGQWSKLQDVYDRDVKQAKTTIIREKTHDWKAL